MMTGINNIFRNFKLFQNILKATDNLSKFHRGALCMETMSTVFNLIKHKRWSEVISWTKEACTDEILQTDSSNFNATPLHLAIDHQAPYEVIKCLVDHGPQATQMKEYRNGYIPLHSSIRMCSPLNVISLLIDAYEEGVVLRDKNQWCSIHMACYFNSHSSVVDLLIASNPSVVKIKTKQEDTALHIACRRKTSLSIVKRLLDIYPEAAKEVVGKGWLPLHLAVWHNAREEVIVQLIKAYPEATKIETSSSGQTPLSIYWSSFGISKNMLSILLDPTTTFKNEEGNQDDGIIHKVLRFPQHIPNLLAFVLDEFQDDGSQFDENGRLPLHVIIESRDIFKRCEWKKIFRRYPNAITQCDQKNSLYPFMIASIISDLDLTYELISLAPTAIENNIISMSY